MPDLTPLPPLPVPPAFRPDVGRFAEVARTARRRRAARTVPVGVALAAVVALGSVTGPAGTSGLDVVDPAGRGATAVTPTPLATPAVADGSGDRSDGGAGGRSTARPGAGQSPAGQGVATLDPQLTATGSPPPPPTQDPNPCPSPWVEDEPTHPEDDWSCSYEPPIEQAALATVAFDPTASCESYHVNDSPGWCLRSRNARTVASGGTLTIVLEACRPTSAGSLTFPDAVEAVLLGNYEGRVAFDRMFRHRWSSQPNAGAHGVTVAAGTCARWSAGWQAVSPLGNALPPGEYRVSWSYRLPDDGNGVRPMAEWTLTVE